MQDDRIQLSNRSTKTRRLTGDIETLFLTLPRQKTIYYQDNSSTCRGGIKMDRSFPILWIFWSFEKISNFFYPTLRLVRKILDLFMETFPEPLSLVYSILICSIIPLVRLKNDNPLSIMITHIGLLIREYQVSTSRDHK